jgi:hypothetical protein
MPTRFEPGAEQRSMRRAANAVRAFNNNQLTGVLFRFQAWKRSAVEMLVVNVT